MGRYGYDRYGGYGGWAPYVPVAERRRKAEQAARKRLKQGQTLSPIKIPGRRIATTFWGTAWCDHLEKYSDFANRLPRGRTYARNGSIIDLQIASGEIQALVAGSSPYNIKIKIAKLGDSLWKELKHDCAQSIHSLIDLMRGKLPDAVLQRLSDPKKGMFPQPKEIRLSCSCPDGASLCKHLAAVLYGVGHRLDIQPELLFLLRGVSQHDLISDVMTTQSVDSALGLDQQADIVAEDLGAIFGIDLSAETTPGDTKILSGKATIRRKVKTKSPAKRTASKRDTEKAKQAAKKPVAVKDKPRKKAAKKVSATTTSRKKAARSSKRPPRNRGATLPRLPAISLDSHV